MVYSSRMGFTRHKRGGGKFTGLYTNKNKNKTARGAKPKSIKPKSYLKTLKKTTLKKPVTADKYIQGILKFLNKMLQTNVNNKTYELYQDTSLNIYLQTEKAMKELDIPMKEYNVEDLDDFIEDLHYILQELRNL
jgi:hypothetical protein